MKTLFLALAAIITVAATVPYMLDILKGKTRPNLVSWFTWTLLAAIATAAELSAGEHVAAIFTGSAGLATGIVLLLGIRHGYVKYARFDVVCQIAAIIGVILWQVFNSPAIGVVAAVTIDFIGALPTIRHAWLKPNEETPQFFFISGIGSVFALLALSTYNWVSLPYAVYLVTNNMFITAIIIGRRKLL